MSNEEKNFQKTNINWYPGHMAKTKRQLKENISVIDIIYEVIDSRIPYSSKMQGVEDITKNKPKILIMTKMDLCDQEETSKWIRYYEKQGYWVIPVDLVNNKNVELIFKKTRELLSSFDERRIGKGLLKRRYRVLVLGIPNVGKSTLINRLVGKKAANVGDRPGVTKKLEWIRMSEDLELLDSPGILWPKLEEKEVALHLASFRAIKEEILPLDTVCTYILEFMNKNYHEALVKRYGALDSKDVVKSFEEIAKKRGCMSRGNQVDYKKVYHIIMNDLIDGKLGLVTFDRVKGD